MDFEESVAACIREGNGAGLTALGLDRSLADEALLCPTPVPPVPGKSGFLPVRRPRPVVYAILCHQAAVVEQLIDLGADIERPLYNGWAPIHYAVGVRDLEIARLILWRAPGQIAAATEHGATPLHIAVANNDGRAAAELLALGADVDAANKAGNTALHLAMVHADTAVAELLLSFGAREGALNSERRTPLAVADARRNASASAFLRDLSTGNRRLRPRERILAALRPAASGDSDALAVELSLISQRLQAVEERLA
jgi:hypothetical protein